MRQSFGDSSVGSLVHQFLPFYYSSLHPSQWETPTFLIKEPIKPGSTCHIHNSTKDDFNVIFLQQ